MKARYFSFLASVISLVLFSSWAGLIPEEPFFAHEAQEYSYAYYNGKGELISHAYAVVVKTWKGHDTLYSESNVYWSNDSSKVNLSEGKFIFRRDSISFISDLSNLVPPRLRYDEGTTVEIQGSPLQYPLYPVKNTPLPGIVGLMKYNRAAGGYTFLYSVVNRQVEGQDTVKVPAGTYPCWIISSIEKVGPLGVKKTKADKQRKVKEWYSPQYGIVKVEYREGNELVQVRVLNAVGKK
jgi:hypothetical protein